jgi:hypothetical protein
LQRREWDAIGRPAARKGLSRLLALSLQFFHFRSRLLHSTDL